MALLYALHVKGRRDTMARRRMIDPNIWLSEDVSKLSIFERLLFIGMFSHADDEGRGRASPALLRSLIFPYDDIPLNQIEEGLDNIKERINVVFYEIEGSSYYQFTNWNKWQRVDKPQPSLIPSYEEAIERNNSENDSKNHSKNNSENDSENDSRLKEKNIKEDNISKKNKRVDLFSTAASFQESFQESESSDKNSKVIRHKYGEYKNVLLSDEEYEKLKQEFPYDYKERIERLSEYIASKGAKYKNHLATIRSWARKENTNAKRESEKEVERPIKIGTIITYDE